MIAGKAVEHFGMALENNQQIVLALAEIMIEIYMAESALLRTQKLSHSKEKNEIEAQIAMAQLNLYHAVESIQNKGKEAIVSFAEGDMQRMLLMGLKRFTKYHEYPNVIQLRNIIAAKITAENNYCF